MRIVVTGGPGGGKSTAIDFFRREIGERVVVVPESATMLFSGGFPRTQDPHARRAAQRAIYHVQRNLEDLYHAQYPERILLCDRGTADGAVYWPGEDYFEALDTSLEAELARYEAVVFFESAAVGGMGIEGGNPARTESLIEAARLDRELHTMWSAHSRFKTVPHQPSFYEKVGAGLAAIRETMNGD